MAQVSLMLAVSAMAEAAGTARADLPEQREGRVPPRPSLFPLRSETFAAFNLLARVRHLFGVTSRGQARRFYCGRPRVDLARNCSIEGSMDQEQQRLVRASFAKVAPIADTAAAVFYERLFATDATLRSLFKGDMVVQGRLLMTMIKSAVENVHRLDQILPAVRDLGRRHARYGVKAADYDTVAGALLGTLEHALGSEFTPPCAMRGSLATKHSPAR